MRNKFYGLHSHNINNPNFFDINFSMLRLWDCGTQWANIEKIKGLFEWSTLDKIVDYCQSLGIEIVYTLGLTPTWSNPFPFPYKQYGKKITPMPPKMEDWINFVLEIGKRYNGKIKYWEVWNEPNWFGFFFGTPKKLADMTIEANKIFKAINPENKMISPGLCYYKGFPTFPLTWFKNYYKHCKDYIDIIATHSYSGKFFRPFMMKSYLKKLVKIAENKEVWNTECSFNFKKISDTKKILEMNNLIKVNEECGIKKLFWYGLDNGENTGGLINNNQLNYLGNYFKLKCSN